MGFGWIFSWDVTLLGYRFKWIRIRVTFFISIDHFVCPPDIVSCIRFLILIWSKLLYRVLVVVDYWFWVAPVEVDILDNDEIVLCCGRWIGRNSFISFIFSMTLLLSIDFFYVIRMLNMDVAVCRCWTYTVIDVLLLFLCIIFS